MAPQIASPPPPVTLAQNKPRPPHAARGDWKVIVSDYQRWPASANSSATSPLARGICGDRPC
jgi:hypothetical protein